jgi:hypothetical protein
MSPTININILDTCILVVNVPISIDRPDDLGHLPMEQAMVGHIMSTIHRAHDRELSNFFALNSNQNELSICRLAYRRRNLGWDRDDPDVHR